MENPGAPLEKEEVVCGLEIHQQLDTGKLFCRCSSELSENFIGEISRSLRLVRGELGEVDHAALREANKKLRFRYRIPSTVCLVEMDDDPPKPVDPAALETSLLLALMVGANIVDEVHFMRKLVIDGSNTSGFQRTSLIAHGGSIDVDGNRIGIQSICLEEDAARPISRKDGVSTYNLDRLGIPLIEIATDPDIHSPEMAKKTAEHIGMLLRATGRVKRGIGTIREDLNISIPGGARIETKGVQELRLIPAYLDEEIARQKRLLAARDELLKRGAKVGEPQVITDIISNTDSKILRKALDKGGIVLAVKLDGFAGLLGPFYDGKKCLGTELAGYAKTVGLGGLFHSDELPAYGVTGDEVARLREHLGLGEQDAFVLLAEDEHKAKLAMELIIDRAKMAFDGVPEETRDPLQDGTTRYSRPLPGKARMYPETDVASVPIEQDYLERLSEHMPEMPWEQEERLVSQYSLSKEQAHQVVSEGVAKELDDVVAQYPNIPIGTVTSTVVTFSSMHSAPLNSVFSKVNAGEVAKEAIPQILEYIREHPGEDVDTTITTLGLGAVDKSEVKARINAIVQERLDFVKEKGLGATGPIMGAVMKEFRGKVDGQELNKLVSETINDALQ